MAYYLTLSGVATTGAGWIALQAADRAMRLTMRTKSFLRRGRRRRRAAQRPHRCSADVCLNGSRPPPLLAFVAFSAVVTIFFTSRVASAAALRIETVASGIRTLARGEYASRVALAGADEVAGLAADVNTLAERLQQAERQRASLERERRDLTAAISHVCARRWQACGRWWKRSTTASSKTRRKSSDITRRSGGRSIGSAG